MFPGGREGGGGGRRREGICNPVTPVWMIGSGIGPNTSCILSD